MCASCFVWHNTTDIHVDFELLGIPTKQLNDVSFPKQLEHLPPWTLSVAFNSKLINLANDVTMAIVMATCPHEL